MAQPAIVASTSQPFIRKSSALPPAAPPSLPVGQGLALAGLAHDARNLVTALKLCSELIAEPGVLAPRFGRYADDLRSIASASDHLVRRLSALTRTSTLAQTSTLAEKPVQDLAVAVRELSGLLAAVAGAATEVQVACLPCSGALRLSEEGLTRILLNLVRNAADAMPSGGRIRVTAQRGGGRNFLWTLPSSTDDGCGDLWDDPAPAAAPRTVVLAVEDDGPGIPPGLADRIFEPGFSTRRDGLPWPDAPHHGLGLSIVRQLVEEAGGTIRAVSPPQRGARFEIELPLTIVTPSLLSELPSETRSSPR
jgi:signal transduction histidine kinase